MFLPPGTNVLLSININILSLGHNFTRCSETWFRHAGFLKRSCVLPMAQNKQQTKHVVSFSELVLYNDQLQRLMIRATLNKKSFTHRCSPQLTSSEIMNEGFINGINFACEVASTYSATILLTSHTISNTLFSVGPN
jgi:hypothetical protein